MTKSPDRRFQALVGDLRTGKINTRIPLTGCSWQQVLNAPGTITSATVDLNDATVAALDLRHAAAPAKSFLAIQYDQTILEAGPIWTHGYKRSDGTLTLGAAGLWSLFDHRKVLPVLAQPVGKGVVQQPSSITNFYSSDNHSLGDVAVSLVKQAEAHVGGDLPLLYPGAQGMTPGASRSYYGYELGWLGQKLTDLTQVINGPEIRFRPQYVPGDPTHVQWVMEVGTPDQPELTQSGADWYFDASVPKSMVSDVNVDVDATQMGTRAWEIGSGSQAGVMLSEADSTYLTDLGYPLLEVEDSHTSVTVQATLDDYAAQYLAMNNRPSEVWKITVRNDGAPPDGSLVGGPRLGEYRAGDYCKVVIGNDPYLSAGERRGRILHIEGDIGFESTLTLATMKAEI